jgi:hypothetical protein
MDEDLDFSVLTNEDLRTRIASVALSADSALAQRKLDVMRAELVKPATRWWVRPRGTRRS